MLTAMLTYQLRRVEMMFVDSLNYPSTSECHPFFNLFILFIFQGNTPQQLAMQSTDAELAKYLQSK